MILTRANTLMAAMKGTSQSGFCPVRRRSRKIRLNTGLIMPINEEIVVVKITNATAADVPFSRSLAYEKGDFRFPDGSNPSSGSTVIQIPVKFLSNSSHGTVTRPLAGSLMTAFFPLNPHRTTKWLNPQCMMQGKGPSSSSASGSSLQAEAFMP